MYHVLLKGPVYQVHELVHLLERKHNELFKAYMDKLHPDWQERKELLNKAPLAYSHWLY